jgi:ABC-type cobalamin transport system ATPase subunit
LLVTVSDAEGLSYYSDVAICRRLHLQAEELQRARAQLRQADLIAYQRPLYQVLSLGDPGPATVGPSSERTGQTQSVADVLRRALQGGAHD